MVREIEGGKRKLSRLDLIPCDSCHEHAENREPIHDRVPQES
jgi:hypothetical protein